MQAKMKRRAAEKHIAGTGPHTYSHSVDNRMFTFIQ